ncbi:MAG: diguanylate cyclase [Planctomycetota bacterium]
MRDDSTNRPAPAWPGVLPEPVEVRIDPPVEGERTLCVLAVRDPGLAERLRASGASAGVAVEVLETPGFLSAMGEAVRRRFDAIVGPVGAMSDMVGPTARALRRLAPGARLVATTPTDDTAEARLAQEAGFDAVLLESVGDEVLWSSLGVGEPGQAASSASEPSAPAVVHRAEGAGGAGWSLSAMELEAEQRLLAALLGEAGALPAVALETARRRFGLPGLTLSSESPGEAGEGSSGQGQLVAHGGQSFGWLVAEGPDNAPERVAQAAAWMGRWLTLDRRMAQLQDLSMRDELTGAWNRRYFNRFLARILDKARSERQQVTLMVFDIDDFKQYNDRYGHGTGDEILREVARLMQSLVRDHDVVARIGGDEFAVIFWDHEAPRRQGSKHPADVLAIARRFQSAVCGHRFPKLSDQAKGTLTISGGIASFPWDGMTPDALLDRADQMALQSKRQGKNAIMVGQEAVRGDAEGGCDGAEG